MSFNEESSTNGRFIPNYSLPKFPNSDISLEPYTTVSELLEEKEVKSRVNISFKRNDTSQNGV